MTGNSLSYQFKTANIIVKIIAVNTLIFLGVRLGAFFMQTEPGILTKWLVLPDAFNELIFQPWSLVTYSFLHFDFGHIFWNMLVLYMFGRIVLNLFSGKRFLTIYLLGAIFGGLLYIVSYNVFSVFEGVSAYLIGASASVRAIMIFIAAYSPNTEVRLIFFNVKLWHIGVLVLIMDVIQLTSGNNVGGMLAHLGGAIFGYVYARQLLKGNDIGLWFEKLIEGIANLFTTRKQKPFKKVHRNTPAKPKSQRSQGKTKNEQQKKVDAILDKISKSGL